MPSSRNTRILNVNLADALGQRVVVRIGHTKELHAIGPQSADRLGDVAGVESHVLHAGPR